MMATNEVPVKEEIELADEKSNSTPANNQGNEKPNDSTTASNEIPLKEVNNSAFSIDGEEIDDSPPSVSYHDIFPELLLKAESKEVAPQYARFG